MSRRWQCQVVPDESHALAGVLHMLPPPGLTACYVRPSAGLSLLSLVLSCCGLTDLTATHATPEHHCCSLCIMQEHQ